jgi:glutamate/tyrosine decarboxylase-like PLP-dependent enzyme
MKDILNATAERATRYLSELELRRVAPSPDAIKRLSEFDEPFPDDSTDSETVLMMLDDIGSPATVASAGGRFFGFVVGGALPASLAANWLAGAWDQNAGLHVASPVSAALDLISIGWLLDIFSLPQDAGGGFTTGATMANFAGLAAARHALLKKQDWDVESRGLFDAPSIKVVVGEEVHVSVLKALSLLGFGRDRLIRVPVDEQGRIRADALPELSESTIICIQAGNVNTGAFDPAHKNGRATLPCG